MSQDVPIRVLIDARNVQRSLWPNIPDEELVELARRWAGNRGPGGDRVRRRGDRAGGRAERVIGGGRFARELTGR